MRTHPRLATAAVAILVSIPAFAAEGRAYLPPQKASAILADGVPWSAEAPNGRTFKLTLNKDGTGSIRALLLTLSATWTVKGEAMCISNAMMSKCLRFTEIAGGLQGWDGNKPDLKVSR